MREILEMCIELDTMAAATYRSLSSASDEPELTRLFDLLAREEDLHGGWWRELLESWDSGLIPDIVTDPDTMRANLDQVRADIIAIVPDDVTTLAAHEMVELAIHMEFFMLDPLFSELIELTEPGRTGHHRDAYARHVDHLVTAIENRRGSDPLARFLARVLRRALHDNELLATYATRDPLTGLYNRRGALGYLNQWTSWAYRYERPITVLLVDIDHFKAINDDHGHAIGDNALIAVAVALTTSTRGSDFVARYGGDEFVIVAPETDLDEYPVLVDRVLDAVREIRYQGRDGEILGLSVSIGGAMLMPGSAEVSPRTVDLLLAGADASMYGAKADGRDRAGTPVTVDIGETVNAEV